ncbi:hypothetical protein VPNG_08503 [Cytospora leucostoma]|uniref:Uncharacterized protein n=1 Tax=Cytospora leucostoma TaxID=1230097 RepID=A0A423W533_9PEZI|nr:hypothetical protein VPNG_08503 [Cytospora leucostoma]
MRSDGHNPSPHPEQSHRQHRHSGRHPQGSRPPSPEQNNPPAALAAAKPEANVDTEVVNVPPGSRKRSRDGEAPQAEQPPLKRIRVADREETHLWTTVKRYIQNPKDFPEPQVSCPICMVEIAIRGIPDQSPDPYKLLDDS